MKIEVSLQSARIVSPQWRFAGCGAVVRFEGVVRETEDGASIKGLEYEAYEPMARESMICILRELAAEFPCEAAFVCHRIGFVPVGEAAILVEIHSAHRGEAFAILAAFMNRLKQEVPIWKKKRS